MRFNLQYFTVFLLSKKINNAVKVFLDIGWKLQDFLLFFGFAKTIYSNKGFLLLFIPIKCC